MGLTNRQNHGEEAGEAHESLLFRNRVTAGLGGLLCHISLMVGPGVKAGRGVAEEAAVFTYLYIDRADYLAHPSESFRIGVMSFF